MKIFKYISKKGFTLAEVLITLVIIGVVASLTIPALINNINKTGYVTALKENYALLQQAFTMLKTENGGSIIPVFEKDTTTNNGNGNALNSFLTKLNYSKNCGNARGCWYDSSIYCLDGTVNQLNYENSASGAYEKAQLSNGTMLSMAILSQNCTSSGLSGPLTANVCGVIYADINGAKGPNTEGRDLFVFWIAQTGIYPVGVYGDGRNCGPGNDWVTSEGCAAKVLTEGAMNY